MSMQTKDFPGAPGGMNLALPAQELDDTEARYLQDILVDYPGIVRRRGPLTPVPGVAALTRPASGLVLTLNPLGQDRYGVLNGDALSGYLSTYSADFSTLTDLALPHPLPTNSPTVPYRVVDAKTAQGGGLWVGISSAYDSNAPNQDLAFWKGATKANYTTGTLTVARGSVTVTGSGTAWSTNVDSGMWLFANTDEGYSSTLIGSVLAVNSDTSITLEKASPYAITAKTYTLQTLRGFAPQVVTGRITTDTTSATVQGGLTKFQSQGLGSGTWQLYRQRDLAFIGKVTSVQTDTSLTLSANAAISLADEPYVAIQADADYSIQTTATTQKVGFLNASYSQRQWFANNGSQHNKTVRLWFADPYGPEAVDISDDGDWLEIDSTGPINEPIQSIASAYNSLLVLKDTETFAVFGSSPTSFSVRKLEDDGVLSGMSVQPYGGGIVWAGRQGIYFYDGTQVNNMTDAKLGDVWKNSVLTFDPDSYRMWSMMVRNHYVLYIENLVPTVAVVKGNVSTTPTSWTIVINMETQAFSMFTNMHMRGAIVLPAAAGRDTWFIVNDATKGVICQGRGLFDAIGNDPFGCDGGTAGPDFYLESKKFDLQLPLLLKRWKQLAIHYLVAGDAMKMDTILGLNNIGETLTSTFPPSVYTWDTLKNSFVNWNAVKASFPTWNDVVQSVFVPKRVRFLKRSQHFAFRLYQASSSVTRLQLGDYELGYKTMRPGRV